MHSGNCAGFTLARRHDPERMDGSGKPPEPLVAAAASTETAKVRFGWPFGAVPGV